MNNIYHVIDAVNGSCPGEEPPTAPTTATIPTAAAAAVDIAQNEARAARNQAENDLSFRSHAHEFQAVTSPTAGEVEAAANERAAPLDPTSLAVAAAVATSTATAVNTASTP